MGKKSQKKYIPLIQQHLVRIPLEPRKGSQKLHKHKICKGGLKAYLYPQLPLSK